MKYDLPVLRGAHSFAHTPDSLLLFLCLGICMPLMFDALLSLTYLFIVIMAVSLMILARYIRRTPIGLTGIILICLFGVWWSTYHFTQHKAKLINSELEGVNISVTGVVASLPTMKNGDAGFLFKVDEGSKHGLVPNSLIKLSCYRCPWQINPSERWRFTVRLKQPHGYASWGAFDYEKYLFRNQITAKGYVRIKGENQYLNSEPLSINQARLAVSEKLNRLNVDGSVGFSMINALVIGDKSKLSAEQRQVFQRTGVSHLMAISGLHVGLVFLVVSVIFRWLTMLTARIYNVMPRPQIVLIPSLVAAFLYSALAGFSISTQRAFIMLAVYVLCRFIARDVSLQKVLLIAMTVILLLDPFSILDIGFWLSCGAVFVIAQLNKAHKKISLLTLQPKLWLGMLPMNVLFFGQVSLISPLVNLLAVPLFCFALIPATLLSVLLLLLGVESIAGWMLLILDKIYVSVYQCLLVISKLSISSWHTLGWGVEQSVLVVLLALAVYKRSALRFLLWVLLVLSFFVQFDDVQKVFQKSELTVSLLDVGQGLSMVVQVEPESYTLVYDTGPRYGSGFTLTDAVVLPFLRFHGVQSVDRLIISHADNDHIGGYQRLINQISVGDVLTSRTDVLDDAIACVAGQKWQVGDVYFEILSPDAATPEGSNNLSCVLRIVLGETVVLITGDIEKQVERYLVESNEQLRTKLKADIMLVPHQGSKTSSTNAFLDLVEPKLALVAAGYRNHYGHPHQDVVERYKVRGIDFVSTIDNGSVMVKINQQGWVRESFRVARRGFWHHQKKPNWD